MSRILVVEDDTWYRELLVEMLVQDGHQTFEAGDGDEALKRMQEASIELVIIDMLMPNKDGLDTITEMGRLGYGIPVIAMSGGRRSLSAEFNLESARLLGVKAALAKPFSRADLRTAISDVMG
ncbi:response regulator [Noviherbaspirillum galbum]|uniref:Response regulator n=1 Tax=Noviherbaspirillum galbum TaxID=2709383 RepID=A0A6B3SMK9_9BURK|nr:response regulator [Noviherbaspirillum galbum]NEX60565.1 response regulator [Noviherbaspirillum galbum]